MISKLYKTLGYNLACQRKKHHLSLSQVAEKLGCSKATVYAFERAEFRIPVEDLCTLSKLYEVSMDDLCQQCKESEVSA